MPSQKSQGKRQLSIDDAPIKRFRVSRACDRCRTAREKCDGKQPVCEPCIEAKRSCTYTSNPKKRGLQPGYIRSLEMALAFVFQHDPEIEALVNGQLAQQDSLLLARGTKESNRLHKSWSKSKFCRDVNKALSGEQISSADDKMPSSDEDSEVDVEGTGLFQAATSPELLDQQMPWTHDPELVPSVSATALISGNDQLTTGQAYSELTPLPPDCWSLLDTYSTYTQCWLPISEKLDLLKLSYSYPEEGLHLSPQIPDAGNHAEMWSIFAVSASEHETSKQATYSNERYEIVKRLIPDELGTFELGHVKALLNLAVFNISRLKIEAAWILVGTASRILPSFSETMNPSNPRLKNVISSCFLLDNVLSMHLERRPYLAKSDIAGTGKIEEDTMEEWQPWNGALKEGSANQSRTPTLALSSFNGLLDVVEILVGTTQRSTARNFLHEMIGRLEIWKATLPSKLNYIRSDTAAIPMTPPAVLLQLAYLTTAFTLIPSSAWLQRIISLLTTLNTQLGFKKAPPIIICLLQTIKRCCIRLEIDQQTQVLMQQVFADVDRAFSADVTYGANHASVFTNTSPVTVHSRNRRNDQTTLSQQVGPSITNNWPPNTDLVHHGHDTGIPPSRPFADALDPSTLESSALDPLDSYSAFMEGDLESFFDDLASIHGAKKLQNQPQFMQNLGYSSEVSMADLLATDPGRFMPLPASSNFHSGNNEQSLRLPLNGNYDAG